MSNIVWDDMQFLDMKWPLFGIKDFGPNVQTYVLNDFDCNAC